MKRLILSNEDITYQDTSDKLLNPKIWNSDMTMRQDVYDKLINIVNEYVENSEIFKMSDIIDAEIVGSNANYNYTDKSDIDLHLVVNMSDIATDSELVQIASNLEKSIFNIHYDIEIRGLEVELYVEDVKAGTMSNGIYSLFNKTWIKLPEPQIIPDYSNDDEYNELLDKWENEGKSLLLTAKSSEEIKSYVDRLYNLRRISLITGGEFSKGNLVFKHIRSTGLLDELKQRKYDLSSQELSIEQ